MSAQPVALRLDADGISGPAVDPPIVGRALSRRFDQGRVVALAGVDLTAAAGETLAVTGASGSGKTTLLNLLGLLDRPDSGELRIDGVSVAHAREVQLRQIRASRLGFVFQDSLLDVNRTAAENVMLGLRYAGVPRARRRGLAQDALELTGMTGRAGAMGATLSGGERQRVAIARAVAHRPCAVLCDEPTGALDSDNTERVVTLLQQLARENAAVVIVTHDLDIAAACDRWAVLRNGVLEWRGTRRQARGGR